MHLVGMPRSPEPAGQYFLDGRGRVRRTAQGRAGARCATPKIGFVFQGFNLLSRTSALENVELPLLYAGNVGMKNQDRHKRAMEVLKAVGLNNRADHHPNQLSGGQRQLQLREKGLSV